MDSENHPDSNAYFNNKRIRRHLIKAGLINWKGEILPSPPSHKKTFARRRPVKENLAYTIANYVIEDEQKHRFFLRNQFDLAIKRSRIQKLRESNHQKQRSMSFSLVHLNQSRNPRAASTTNRKRLPIRAKSAHRSPTNVKNQVIRRPTTAKQSSKDDYCEVTMIYFGPPKNVDYKKNWSQPNGDEILVMQQHCGGENLPVFKGFVKPNETFTFDSHRHSNYPFALALYINGLIDSRISVCCEYKHKHNVRLGSKYGLFGIYDVRKSQPCRMCRFEQRRKQILSGVLIEENPTTNEKSILTREFRSGALLRTPTTSPEREKTSSKQGMNRISTVVQASVSPRISSSVASENKGETHKSDQKQDDSRKSSRISSGSSRKSGPSSSTILFQHDEPHHSSEPIFSKREKDDTESLSSSRKSDVSSPISDDNQQSLKLFPENKNTGPSSSSTSSSTALGNKNDNQIRSSSSSSSMTLKRFSSSSSSSIFSEKENDHPTTEVLPNATETEKRVLSSTSETSRSSLINPTDEKLSSSTSDIVDHSLVVHKKVDSPEPSETSAHSIHNGHKSPRSSSSSTDNSPINEIITQNPDTDTSDDEDFQSNSITKQHRRNEIEEEPASPKPEKPPIRQYRPAENIIIVWLDSKVDETDADTLHSKSQLRQIARTLQTYNDPTKCLQLFQEIQTEQIFLIVSGSLSETILPQIDDYPQPVVVYIFCQEKLKYENLMVQYPKVKGIYTDVSMICERLKIDSKQWDNDLRTFEINSEELVFIQNQLFKEFLLEIEYDRNSIHDLAEYCSKIYNENDEELNRIKQFKEDYGPDTAIDWYTKDCFVYYMLNRAIRMKDMKILFQMAFLIRDINQQMEERYSSTVHRSTLTVFRGQGMKFEDFEDLKQNQGGLLAFNGLISTSKKQNIAYEFAQRSLSNGFPIAVLFRIKIDPNTTSSPFISLENPSEYEILLSFKSIFYIGSLEQLENNLWQIDLTLTDEISPSIQIEYEKYDHLIGYEKLGELFIDMNEFTKAKDLYEINLPDSSNPKYSYVCNQLALIYTKLQLYNQALAYYHLSLRATANDYGMISTIHNEMGKIFYQQKKFREAFEEFQYALNIQLEYLPANDLSLVNTYDLLAMIAEENEDYQTALDYHQKQLDIQTESSLTKPSDLAETYLSIGICLEKLNQLNEALDYLQKSIDISPAESNDRQEILQIIRERIE